MAGAAVAAGLGVDVAPSATGNEPPIRTAVAMGTVNSSVQTTSVVPASGVKTITSEGSIVSAGNNPERSTAEMVNLAKAVDASQHLAQEARQARAVPSDPGPKLAAQGGGAFANPTVGQVTSGFGSRGGAMHGGTDIANKIGTPIYAVANGQVVDSGPASGFGLWVRVRHSDGFISVYGHINRSLVSKGQQVKAGQQIAEMGNRGQSTGPHLHLEIWNQAGTRLDPAQWASARGLTLGRQA